MSKRRSLKKGSHRRSRSGAMVSGVVFKGGRWNTIRLPSKVADAYMY